MFAMSENAQAERSTAPTTETTETEHGAGEHGAKSRGGQFTSSGAIPPVAHAAAAAGGSPSASDRAYGSAVQFKAGGGIRNVDMASVNTDHKAKDVSHKGDKPQSSRIGLHGGHMPVIKTETSAYASDGTELGPVHKGHIQVNAGAFTSLMLPDEHGTLHKRDCVFTHGSHPGWVDLRFFEDHAALHRIAHHEQNKMDHGRHAAVDEKHGGPQYYVRGRQAPSEIRDLFTKPNQQASANHVHDYFVRPGNTQNLLVNVPSWTHDGGHEGERFGVAGDIINTEGDTVFHATGEDTKVPVFERHHNDVKGHIHFVYGFIVNNAGDKRLGWLPQHVLEKKS